MTTQADKHRDLAKELLTEAIRNILLTLSASGKEEYISSYITTLYEVGAELEEINRKL